MNALALAALVRGDLLSADNRRLRELLYGAPSPSLQEWAARPSPFPGLTRGELDLELSRLRAAGEYSAAEKRRAIARLPHRRGRRRG